nr:atherin-like [Aegilops tauschii subsp. strangulata]
MATHQPGRATPSPPAACTPATPPCSAARHTGSATLLLPRRTRADEAAPAYGCYVRGRRCPSPAAALLRQSRRTPPLVARPPAPHRPCTASGLVRRPPASLWPRPAAPPCGQPHAAPVTHRPLGPLAQ